MRPIPFDPFSLVRATEAVLLDTARADQENKRSLLFVSPRTHLVAYDPVEVIPVLRQIDRLSKTCWLAGYLRYEAVYGLLPKKFTPPQLGTGPRRPLVWFGVYDAPSVVTVKTSATYTPRINVSSNMSYASYAQAIARIKDEIHAGNTYQVNLTFDMTVGAGCSPEALYLYLRKQQTTPYCAFLKNKDDLVLSFSPELFFRRSGDKILSRPMKGTTERGKTPSHDRAQKKGLASDKKNRAENLMIVDLLRNDFGRICQTGTVETPSLFDVETHPTLHQMTSLIEGRLRPEMSYLNIFESLFPCGSVTGAPKLKTMEIIQQIEEGRRGIYCGAIGYISPEKEAVFSVPIRILQQREDHTSWQYRVGGGVVWDSRCRGEWNEAGLKSSFLTRNQVASFSLIETMLWKKGKLAYGPQHLKRLKNSARELGIKCKTRSISGVWAEMLTQLCRRPQAMVRFLMDQNGVCRYEFHTRGLSQSKGACLVRISNVILDAQNVWLRHKTTYRPWYAAAMKKISGKKVWDELFFNQHGQLCEGARSNVFVRLGTQLYTPPVSCGLLPGILRQDLLAQGKCQERMLTRNDVLNADELFCGNSVRGLQKVVLKK